MKKLLTVGLLLATVSSFGSHFFPSGFQKEVGFTSTFYQLPDFNKATEEKYIYDQGISKSAYRQRHEAMPGASFNRTKFISDTTLKVKHETSPMRIYNKYRDLYISFESDAHAKIGKKIIKDLALDYSFFAFEGNNEVSTYKCEANSLDTCKYIEYNLDSQYISVYNSRMESFIVLHDLIEKFLDDEEKLLRFLNKKEEIDTSVIEAVESYEIARKESLDAWFWEKDKKDQSRRMYENMEDAKRIAKENLSILKNDILEL